MTAAHTSGPWETASNGEDWDVCTAAAGDMVADLRDCDNAEANAHLIAAAPALLAALDKWLLGEGLTSAEIEQARALVKTLRGEQ